MKETVFVPSSKKNRVVSAVAAAALALSMIPVAGIAWAADTEPSDQIVFDDPITDTSDSELSSSESTTKMFAASDSESETGSNEVSSNQTTEEPNIEKSSDSVESRTITPQSETVAENGTNTYSTLADALNAARSGDTIKLVANASIEGTQYGINKDLTIDLNGYTLDLNQALYTTANTNVAIKNGKIQANNLSKAALIFKGTASLSKVNINAGGNQPALKADAGSFVSLEKGTIIAAQNDAVTINGAATTFKLKSGAAVNSEHGTAMKIEGVAGGNAKIDLDGSVNGGTGYALVLSGANVTSGEVVLTQYSNATIASTSDLAIRCQLPTATLNFRGGKINAANRGVKMEAGSLNAFGTSFNCKTPLETTGSGAAVVTGGNFGGDVTPFIKAGYTAQYNYDNNRFEIVAIGDNVAQIIRESDAILFTNIDDALAALEEGDTLTLLKDIEVSSSTSTNSGAIKLPRLATLNGNGHTITAGTFSNPAHMINILAGGVTVKDLKIDMGYKENTKHGINLHSNAAWAKIENVEIVNANTAALVVNGSAPQGAIVSGLTTSGNKWGAINVDKGGTLVFNSGDLTETNKIWTETDSNSSVTINAEGFDCITTYDLGGSGVVMTYYTDTETVASLACADADGVKFGDLQLALDRATDGATVAVLNDLNVSKIISVTKSVTLNGNSHKIESSASRILWIESPDVTVALNDLKLVSSVAERGVQVNVGVTGVDLTINNCTIPGTYYAINMCSNTSVELTINNSIVSGWGALNLWGDSYTVTATNSTFIGHNDKDYNAQGWNGFGVIVLEGDTTGATEEHVSNCTVNLIDCVINASSETGNLQRAILFNNPSANNSVTISGDNTVVSYPEGQFCANNGENNLVLISAGSFTDDVSDFCIEGKKWEQGKIVEHIVIPENPAVPGTPDEPSTPDAPEVPNTPTNPTAPSNQGATPNTPATTTTVPAGNNPAPTAAPAITPATDTPAVANEPAAQGGADDVTLDEAITIEDDVNPLANISSSSSAEEEAAFDLMPVLLSALAVGLLGFFLIAAWRRRKDSEQ